MKWEHFWQVLFALIGAFASAYAGYWLGNQPEQVGILEYRIYPEENLTGLFGKSDDLKITYKGVEQPDLSRVSIGVANTSKNNVEKVRLYIEVKDKTRTPIISDFVVPEGYPRDLVKALPTGNGIYSYELDYMNRTTEFWDGFRFTLYFPGSKAPEIDVRAAAKGFTLRKFELEHLSTSRILLDVMVEEWWLIVLYFAVAFLFFRYIRIAHRLQEAKMRRQLISLMPETLNDAEKVKRAEEAATLIKASPSFTSVLQRFFRREGSSNGE